MRRLLAVLGLCFLTACPETDDDDDRSPRDEPTTGTVEGTLNPIVGAIAVPRHSPPSALAWSQDASLREAAAKAVAKQGIAQSKARAEQDSSLDSALPPTLAGAETGNPDIIEGEFIVRFEEKGLQAMSSVSQMKVSGYRTQHGGHVSENAHLLRFEPEDSGLRAWSREENRRLAEKLRQRPGVRYVEENRRVHPTAAPNDELYSAQWHYPAMNLPAAWNVTTGSSSVVVAVLDSGIKPHPDFAGRLLPGMDMISDSTAAGDGNGRDSNPNDEGRDQPQNGSSWHGTHVAGTIGASHQQQDWGGRSELERTPASGTRPGPRRR